MLFVDSFTVFLLFLNLKKYSSDLAFVRMMEGFLEQPAEWFPPWQGMGNYKKNNKISFPLAIGNCIFEIIPWNWQNMYYKLHFSSIQVNKTVLCSGEEHKYVAQHYISLSDLSSSCWGKDCLLQSTSYITECGRFGDGWYPYITEIRSNGVLAGAQGGVSLSLFTGSGNLSSHLGMLTTWCLVSD